MWYCTNYSSYFGQKIFLKFLGSVFFLPYRMYQLSVSLFKGSKRYLSYNRSQYKPLVQKKTNELILKKNKLSLNAIRSYSTADNNFSDIYDELDNLDDFYDPSLDAEIAEEEYGLC